MAKIGRPPNEEPDFWPLVKIGKKEECWNFIGRLDKNGYGKFRIKPDYLAHRISYRFKVGPIPSGGHILHSCDNPSCCNPAHLFLGNHSKNMQDMWDKKRHPRPVGELNNHAKLTLKDIEEIRRRYDSGEIQKSIAKSFKVTQTNISFIVRRQTWI